MERSRGRVLQTGCQEAAKRSCETAAAYVVLFYILSQHQSGLVVEVYQQPTSSMGTHTRTRTGTRTRSGTVRGGTRSFSPIPSSRSRRVCHAVTVSLRASNMAAVALRLLLFLSVTHLPLRSCCPRSVLSLLGLLCLLLALSLLSCQLKFCVIVVVTWFLFVFHARQCA